MVRQTQPLPADVVIVSFLSDYTASAVVIDVLLSPSDLPIDKGQAVVYDPPHGSVGQPRYLRIPTSLLNGGFGAI